MFIISLLLIAGVAAGIAWPLVQRQRAKAEAGIETATVPATSDVITSQRATEQLCPHCSKMNSGNRTVCIECGNTLAAKDLNSLLDTVEKQEMVREMTQLGLLFVAMVVAMCLSNWLPTSGKLAVLLVTFCVLVFRGWKQLID